MGGVTDWVRRALGELGLDAPDKDVKAYIAREAPDVPQGQISLALRKLRGRGVSSRRKPDSGAPSQRHPKT